MLDKPSLKAAIISAFESIEHDGTSHIDSLASKLANAMDAFVKSGTVMGQTTTGNCTASGVHPTIKVTGSVK